MAIPSCAVLIGRSGINPRVLKRRSRWLLPEMPGGVGWAPVTVAACGTKGLFGRYSGVAWYSGTSNDIDRCYERMLPSSDLVRLAFAYGSRVFSQGKSSGSAGMLDFIFVVDDVARWHQTLLTNPERRLDYSPFARVALGADLITRFQQGSGAEVWFNTDARVADADCLVKYGVISTHNFLRDLRYWNTLYLSGRLHKPVKFLEGRDADDPLSKEIEEALETNLCNAVHSALLLLPATFSEVEFYLCVSNISYAGDVRMLFAENPDKVGNIVLNNLEYFRKLYAGFLGLSESHHSQFKGAVQTLTNSRSSNCFEQCLDPDVRRAMWTCHPLARKLSPWDFVSQDLDLQRSNMASALSSVVSRSALKQTFAGLVTAGPASAFWYALRKVGKRFTIS